MRRTVLPSLVALVAFAGSLLAGLPAAGAATTAGAGATTGAGATNAATAGPTISVTPTTGLHDIDSVTVTGTGWTSSLAGSLLCNNTVLAAAPAGGTDRFNYLLGNCRGLAIATVTGGTFSANLGVDAAATHCGAAPYDCSVTAMGEFGANVFSTNAVPLLFLSAGPQFTSDCDDGGWRNPDFLDQHGQPFTSRAACIAYTKGYGLNRRASGNVTGTHAARPTPSCAATTRFRLTVDAQRGDDKLLVIDACDAPGGATGRFRYEFGNGTLRGTITGVVFPYPGFSGTLTVTSASGELCNVTGTLTMSSTVPPWAPNDPVQGSLTSSLQFRKRAC